MFMHMILKHNLYAAILQCLYKSFSIFNLFVL